MFRLLLFLSIYSTRFFPTHELILPNNNQSLLDSTFQFNTKSSYNTIYQSSKIISLAYYTYNTFLASNGTNEIGIFDNFSPTRTYTKPTRSLLDHNASVTALKSLSRGLASGSTDGMIFIWSFTLNFNFSIQAYSANIAILSLCELSRDLLLSGSQDTSIKLWDLSKGGSLVRQFQGHSGGVNALASFENGNFASGSSDSSVKIWNANSGQLVMTLTGHTSSVNALVYLYGNGFVASGSSDKTIKIWNITSGALKETIAEHNAPVTSLETIKTYINSIFSCSSDGAVKKWYFYSYGSTSLVDAFTFDENFACSSVVYMGEDVAIAGFRFNDVPGVSVASSGYILAWDMTSKVVDPYESSSDVIGIIAGVISGLVLLCCICGCCCKACSSSSSSSSISPSPPAQPAWSSSTTATAPPETREKWMLALIKVS